MTTMRSAARRTNDETLCSPTPARAPRAGSSTRETSTQAWDEVASQADSPSPRGLDSESLCDPSPRCCSRLGAQLDRPPLALRARVFASRRSLDEALADGASPLWSPELARRARQLVSRGSRQQLANSLERLVKEAQRSVSPRAVAVLLPRREISEAETSLFSIATRLRDERPMYARGTALLSQLLSDGSGPMYNAHTGGSLGRAVGAIAAALDGRWRTRRSAGVGGRERERA